MKTAKRLFALLLAVAMVVAYVPPMSVHATSAISEFAGGSGTEDDPYLIETKDHLNNVRNHLDAQYKLIADIVFTDADFAEGGSFYNEGKGWQPIGNATTPFCGIFDGNGYSIKGLTINSDVEANTYLGLFGYVSGSIKDAIKNINAIDFSITVNGASTTTSSSYTYLYVGSIVGYGSANNCSSSGDINISYTSSKRKCYIYVGGINGYGSAANCTNYSSITVNVSSGSAYVFSYIGGIAGRGETISNCTNSGTLSANSQRNYYSRFDIGGIAGGARTVSLCANLGPVTGKGSSYVTAANVGGILGFGYDTSSTVDQCYNTACITGLSDQYTGGIVGDLGNDSKVSNSFNTGAVFNGYNGGIVGYAESGTTISNCYNIGCIENGDGIADRISNEATFNSCYSLEGVSFTNNSGIICSDQEMRKAETFVNFDFDTIWQLGNNANYPWPELQALTVIKPVLSIADCTISLSVDEVHYHDRQPEFTVVYDGNILALNDDYMAFFVVGDKSWRVYEGSYSYIPDIGIGKIKIVGIGDFCSTATHEFTIDKYDIANASLWTKWIYNSDGSKSSSRFYLEDFIYDGTEKVQTGFRVCDTNDTIDPENYEITYKDNINIGTATMIITGKGDYYTGTLEKQFQISPRVLQYIEVSKLPNKLIYTEDETNIDVTGGEITLYYQDGGTETLPMTADMLDSDITLYATPAFNIWINYQNCTTYYQVTVKPNAHVLAISANSLLNPDSVWINGAQCTVTQDGDTCYIALPEGELTNLVSYSYNDNAPTDIHTQYPTGMQVWRLNENADGTYSATHVKELDNILQYAGSSIRITGTKGIRMITSIEKAKKSALTGGGLAGYKVVEYGTALCWAKDLEGDNPMVLGQSYVKSNYAYKRGVADPVFAQTNTVIQYTNVLVGFNLDQCKDDIAMRPYIILEDASGTQIIVYGGIVYRSIGYIAYQNRNVFAPGNASYNYVWEIIHHVYGKKYDSDYKG